ncbi:MAG: hypothetical protein WAL45_06855 [Terracidiphilus sp.]
MQFIQFLVGIRSPRRIAACLCILAALGISAPSQTAGGWTHKPTPAKIDKQILIFPDSVVVEQWPHTLKLVNPPQNLELLNPGECVRIGIVANGDDRDSLLEKTQLSFHVEFAGQTQDHALAPLAGMKQIKPEGGDFVLQALASANVEAPPLSMASLGASADKWCVPDDAQDGTATIDAEIESPAGHQKQSRVKIQIESLETGRKHTFRSEEDLEKFTMGFHYQPNPARLYPELLFFCADQKISSDQSEVLIQAAFLGAALKADPIAAKDFMARIAARNECPQGLGMMALLMGGYNVDLVLDTMSAEDRQTFKEHSQLPDPYDFGSPAEAPTHFDMLWGMFTASGQFASIKKIASALAWRPDWDDYVAARNSSHPPKAWTPSLGRALAYSAAGWSMISFQHTDPLAADYIGFLIASPDTPDAIKAELKGLPTNPAFKRQGDQ